MVESHNACETLTSVVESGLARERPANDNNVRFDVSVPGRWAGHSAKHVEKLFQKHNKISPWPEQFEGVVEGVKPPSNRRAWIVHEFELRPRERNGQNAPCNICLNSRKCGRYSILIMDELGHLYLVGRDCAARHFPDGEFNRWEREYQATQKLNDAFDFMLRVNPTVPAWVSFAEALQPFEVEIGKAYKLLWKTSPKLLAQLSSSLTDGGLVVYDRSVRLSADGRERTTRIKTVVAQFSGRPVLRDKYVLAAKLKNALSILRSFTSRSDDEVLEMAIAGQDEGTLVKSRRVLQSAIQDVRDIREEIAVHRTFYSPGNFDSMRVWNDHDSGPRTFRFSSAGKVRSISSPHEDMFKMRFDLGGATLPSPPSP